MKVEFNNGAMVTTENCVFCDVYRLDIDEGEKKIELGESHGPMIGLIYFESEDFVDVHPYDADGRLTGNIMGLVEDGELMR